jgi:hypothetical protein
MVAIPVRVPAAILLLMLVPAAASDPISDPAMLLEAPRNATADVEATGVRLSWDAPAGTAASGPPVAYRILVSRNGVDQNAFALDAEHLEFFDDGAVTAQVLVYRLSAVYGDGSESIPIMIYVGRPYPPCNWLVYSLSPPDVIIRPECFIP